MNVCELTEPPFAALSSGTPSLGRMTPIVSFPDALIMSKMKSSWPTPLTTMASRSPIFLMSSGRGW